MALLVVGLAGVGAGVAIFANPGGLVEDTEPTALVADDGSGAGVSHLAVNGRTIYASNIGGLSIYDDAYALTSQSAANSAIGLDVYPLDLVSDADDLWLVSSIGVDRYVPGSSTPAARYAAFGVNDAVFDRARQVLFASTSNGLVAFDVANGASTTVAPINATSLALVDGVVLAAAGSAVDVVGQSGIATVEVGEVNARVVQVVVHDGSAAALVQTERGGRLFTWADARALAAGQAANAVVDVGQMPSRVALDDAGDAFVIDAAYGDVLVVRGAQVSATLTFASAAPTDLVVVE